MLALGDRGMFPPFVGTFLLFVPVDRSDMHLPSASDTSNMEANKLAIVSVVMVWGWAGASDTPFLDLLR